MDTSQPVRVIWKARRWILLFALAVAGGAYGITTVLPKSYQATAQTQIVSGQQASGTYVDPASLTQLTNIYDQQATTLVVAGLAAKALGRHGVTARTMQDHVSVALQLDTQGLSFTGTADRADQAAAYANAYANAFASYVAGTQANQRAQALTRTDSQINDVEQKLSNLSSSTSPAAVALTTELQALQSQAAQLQSRVGDSINVIQPATPPAGPAAPKPKLDAVLALLAGLVLGAGAAYARFRLVDRFDSADGAALELGLFKLGELPRSSGPRDGASQEALRALGTTVDYVLRDEPRPAVLVTSAVPGSGKTYLVANLGRAMALGERRVLAADVDLRRPSLHEAFGIPLEPGMGDLLVRPLPVGEELAPPPAQGSALGGNLEVIPAGRVVPDPVASLSSRQMTRVLERLRAGHDLVLLDCTPTEVADPMVLAREVQGVILVVDLRSDRRRAVHRCLEMLRSVDAPVLGCVINRTSGPYRGYSAYYKRRAPVASGSPASGNGTAGQRGQVPVPEHAPPVMPEVGERN